MRIATRRIADDLERELDGQRGARRVARWPRQCDADETAREQQRVRGGIARGQMRAIAAVDAREQRILAARRLPALAHRRDGKCHGVRGLVTSHTAAAVRA
jgi:hypothetical protein